MDKYKVIKEYESYYLCEHEKHKYKECFNKFDYKLNEEGYIVKQRNIDLDYMKKLPGPYERRELLSKVGV